MTRRFYTDPLAAAWMAKHYGMKIDSDDIPSFWDENGKSYFGSKHWHIHPDSLNLLEPRVGDMISHLGLRAWLVDAMDETAYHHPAVGSEKIDRFTLKSDDPTIIQRDGKPFFWPESEAV